MVEPLRDVITTGTLRLPTGGNGTGEGMTLGIDGDGTGVCAPGPCGLAFRIKSNIPCATATPGPASMPSETRIQLKTRMPLPLGRIPARCTILSEAKGVTMTKG